MAFICAKFGADLIEIFKLASRKTNRPYFLGLYPKLLVYIVQMTTSRQVYIATTMTTRTTVCGATPSSKNSTCQNRCLYQ